jgi:hypothetical protein
MNMTISASFEDYKLKTLFDALGPSNRQRLLAVGGKQMEVLARSHLGRVAPTRHATADALGAKPTGLIRKGIARTVATATAEYAELTIPIPGIRRAYGTIKLSTPTRRGRKFFTIPKHAAAYGQTVETLRRRGWKIFRPGQKQILLGYRRKGDKPVILYSLAKKATLREDPSLLPTRNEFGNAFAGGIKNEIDRRLRAAQGKTEGGK